MATNLAAKYSDKIAAVFVKESLVSGKLSNAYDFIGAKTVKIYTPQTVEMSDYDKSAETNRYGKPKEMQDVIQELTLSQDKSFSLTIDKGNNIDQMNTKGAMEMLGRQVKERAIPAQDKHTLEVLSKRAGNIVANASALTKANVCERISTGTQTLDDAEIPDTDRWLFVSSLTYKYLRLSDEFMKVDSMAKESLEKGVVGMYDNMSVVKIPAARWPSNVNFIICHKSSATSPSKISETKCHKDPPGISGNLLEGRFYYDCFVLAARCNGVYAEIDASQGKGVVCAAPTQTNGTFASTTAGASFKYTDDGSDPRYSLTAKAEATESAAAGTVIRVYAYKTGNFDSAVFTYTAQ